MNILKMLRKWKLAGELEYIKRRLESLDNAASTLLAARPTIEAQAMALWCGMWDDLKQRRIKRQEEWCIKFLEMEQLKK